MHARPPSRRLPATPPGIRTESACVCFGILGADSEFVRNLVLDLKESGLAKPSWTTLNGEAVVRYAIVNHRTTVADIEGFVDVLDECLARSGIANRGSPSLPICKNAAIPQYG
jgi:hypothetical protein